MKTHKELDQMHDAVIARFSGGMNFDQFKLVTLESADDAEDGRVYPPHLTDMFGRHSWLIRMWFDKLLEHWDDGSGRPVKHQPMNYKITDTGRAWLAENKAALTP